MVLLLLLLPALGFAQPNTLTPEERAAGFELIFNGSDLHGWDAPAGNWAVERGALARVAPRGGITYTRFKIPDDFELRFEWKVAPGSNSGVYYRPGQYEYQVLDNQRHRDGRFPDRSAASLYYFAAPSRDATRPVGEWNTGRIVCQGTRIEHWLNEEKVIDLDYSDPKWKDAIGRLRERGADIEARGRYLHMQDHGDPVWYRSLRLRSLGR